MKNYFLNVLYRLDIMDVFLTVSPPLRAISNQRMLFDDDLFYLSKIKLCSKRFIIYPEFDVAGRLHYHAIINIHDKVKWYKAILPTFRRMLGFCDVKVIKTFLDKLRVLNYIRKDWYITSNVLKLERPIMPQHRKLVIHVNTCDLDYGVVEQLNKTTPPFIGGIS